MAQAQIQWPPITKNFKILAISLFILWFASVMVPPLGALRDGYLLVSAAAMLQGQVWTVFTYAFWHVDFLHLLFNLWILWIFGTEVERRWTTKRWWSFQFACAFGGGIAVVLSQFLFQVAYPTLGYSGAVMGIVAAFAWYNWDRKVHFFFFSLKGKSILLLFIALDIVVVFVGREPISIAAHLGGMATGLLLVSDLWRPKKLREKWRHYQRRRRFKVVRKEAEEDRRKHMN